MKRILPLLLFFSLALVTRAGGIKDAYRAVFNLVTYDTEGNRLLSGYGAFVAEDGTAVSAYSLLRDAARAEVVDAKGNRYPVHRILGASAAYDVVKFSVEGMKKTAFFPLSAATPVAGASLSLVNFTDRKKAALTPATLKRVEPYDRYTFLYTDIPAARGYIGLPLVDAEGALVGLVQAEADTVSGTSYAVDARFCADLSITGTSVLSADLRALSLPKALPADAAEALSYLYMMPRTDTVAYATALTDFITAHPDEAEGYVLRATFHAGCGRYTEAEAEFVRAEEKAASSQSRMKADEVLAEYSKAVYQRAIVANAPAVEGWTLDRAATLAERAYAVRPRPYYLLQHGRCLFSLHRFVDAHRAFLALCNTSRTDSVEQWSSAAQAEAWFFAARSLELSGGDSLQVIALMDSAIATLPTPYGTAAMPYFLERAQRLTRAGEYRRAVMDYNEYERTIGPSKLNARFYYIREQAELNARMYQQALDDMRTAITLSPDEPLYRIEEALVMLRVGMYDEAAARCETLIRTTLPDSPDCYKIAGIAYGEKGQRAKAVTALRRAVELGDENARIFLEKYQ